MAATPVEIRRRIERETMYAVYARACGEPVLGPAGYPDAFLLFELPTPWPPLIWKSSGSAQSITLRKSDYVR